MCRLRTDIVTRADGDGRLQRYAALAVRVGANVQPGQLVEVMGLVEHAPLVREVAREAWRAGARWVDVNYVDNHIRRAMIELAPDEALGYTPPWLLERARAWGSERGAAIVLTGDPNPDLMSGLDGERVGRARMRELTQEYLRQSNERLVNWTILAAPNEGWANAVFGEPDVERLWEAVAHAVRLDDPDPVEAWRRHAERLAARAQRLNELALDALRFRGPGTDLTVGLLPESSWGAAEEETVDGIRHLPNMPTEEVFTVPDRRRTTGRVRSTMPLVVAGALVRGLEIRFEDGRAVEVDAEEGAGVIRGMIGTDEGAAHLGEVALVDGGSRVGQTGITFYDTLFDENASCHIALGDAPLMTAPALAGLEPEERAARGVNGSAIHTDFMIGGPDLAVDGVRRDGSEIPLLRANAWQLPE